jgi:hypothetical protein
MSYQDHLATCSYCSKNNPQKPTVRIKAASSYRREKRREERGEKLSELASVIRGVSYPSISYVGTIAKTKAASSLEKSQKLKELGRLIRGL